MEAISVKCKSCKAVLKFGADKAGRKTRCKKCGEVVVIPAPAKTPAAEEKPAPPAPPPKPAGDDDDDDVGAYQIVAAPEEDKKKEPEKKKQERGPARRKLKQKTIQDAELWEKGRVGMIIIVVGMGAWGLALLIQAVIILLGMLEGPQYSAVLARVNDMAMKQGPPPPPDKEQPMPRAPLGFGLLMGADNITLAQTLYMVIYILNLLQGGAFLGGYIFFTMVPNLNGLRGQAFALLGVGAANLVFGLIFKLLPAVGVMDYTIMALLTPEVAMLSANIERSVPLQLFWATGPAFWEISLALLITLTFYAEPVLLCIYLRSMATAVKDEQLQPRTMMLLELSVGVMFVVLAYYLLSICGTSDVLGLVLKAVYALWFGFVVWMVIALALFLLEARTILHKYIVASEEEEAEGGKKKPKARDEDEEDEEEDEDEDDEDEEDDEDDEDED